MIFFFKILNNASLLKSIKVQCPSSCQNREEMASHTDLMSVIYARYQMEKMG